MTATVDTDWVIRDRVPVYDAHELEITDPKTGKVVRRIPVTEERLQDIADARNAKIERSGDDVPVYVGHTTKGRPEHLQPPIVGYADKFEVRPHEADGRPTLYARYKLYPTSTVGNEELSADEIMRRWPRRSPEIWLDDNDLDGVSLLGPTTPARHLGLLRMAKAAEVEMPPEAPGAAAPPAPPAAAPAGGGGLDEFLAALMGLIEQFAGGGPEQMEAASPTGPMDNSPTPAQYAAVGATNAGLPELEKVRMQKDQDAIRYRRLEEEVKQLRADNEATKIQYQRKQDETRLIQMEAEGVECDRVKELEHIELLRTKIGSEAAEAHFDRLVQYQRSGPGYRGPAIRTADLADTASNPYRDTPTLQKAEAHMLKHPGMGFNEALAAVKAG